MNIAYLKDIISLSQENRIRNATLTGSHIIIRQHGRELLNQTYGFQNAKGETLLKNATYRIASMTKPITAVALLIAQDKGLLNVYDEVFYYLKGYDKLVIAGADGTLKPNSNPLKLYMLVSHISGINSLAMEKTEYNIMPLKQRTLQTVAEYAPKVPLCFAPGTAQIYNTIGFDIAARIIEITSNMPFDAFLKTQLFDKLDMPDTVFAPNANQWQRAVGIHSVLNGRAIDLNTEENSVIDGHPVTYFAAGCALLSTARDYMKFAEMLQNNGMAQSGERILSENAIKILTEPVVNDNIMPGSQKWCLGMRVITDNDYILPKGSFGWSGKYGSHFWVDPQNGITAVYMKNSTFDGGAGCQTAVELEQNVMKANAVTAV